MIRKKAADREDDCRVFSYSNNLTGIVQKGVNR
jgi:hypothetical protein